jgi:hypothetical protein
MITIPWWDLQALNLTFEVLNITILNKTFDFGFKILLFWYMNFSHVTILIQIFLQLHLCVIYDSFTLLKKICI